MSTRFFWRRPSIVVEDPTLVVSVRLPAVLGENLPFRRFWLGRAISLFGDQISLVAVPLAALLVPPPHAGQMGYLVAAGPAPELFFALPPRPGGDRRRR